MKKILFVLLGVAASAQDEKVENDARFHPLLLSAAKSHETYGIADDAVRFAPELCMAPSLPVRLSASKDPATHGQKLYFLYAWDAESYLKDGRKERLRKTAAAPVYEQKPASQVLVKQSWAAVAAEQTSRVTSDRLIRFLRKDGQLFTTGEKKELFIMVKLDEKTEGTDRGWVYGTVTPDGKSVTSAGRVRSCMDCHEKAGDGRLFGLPKADKK
jgi:cytochrome P460